MGAGRHLKEDEMSRKTPDNINLKAIRFSLFLKVLITCWAFYISVTSPEIRIALMYLVLAIVFAGLFVFQLKYYRKKKAELEKNDP